jgi:hypothetical protein
VGSGILKLANEQSDWLAERIPHVPRSPLGGRPTANQPKIIRGSFWMFDNGAGWKSLPRPLRLEERRAPLAVYRKLQPLQERNLKHMERELRDADGGEACRESPEDEADGKDKGEEKQGMTNGERGKRRLMGGRGRGRLTSNFPER